MSSDSSNVKFVEGLQYFQDEVHQVARDKGWYAERIKTDLESMMLMVSELGEAAEEVRKGTPLTYFVRKTVFGDGGPVSPQSDPEYFAQLWEDPTAKPEGVAAELADVVLRILDYAAYKGIDLSKVIARKHTYNKTRSYRHGGKAL